MATDKTFKILAAAMKKTAGNLALSNEPEPASLEPVAPLSVVPRVPTASEVDEMEHQVPLATVLERLEQDYEFDQSSSADSRVTLDGGQLDEQQHVNQLAKSPPGLSVESPRRCELDEPEQDNELAEMPFGFTNVETLVGNGHQLHADRNFVGFETDEADWEDERLGPIWEEDARKTQRRETSWSGLWDEQRPGARLPQDMDAEKAEAKARAALAKSRMMWKHALPALVVTGISIVVLSLIFTIGGKRALEQKPLAQAQTKATEHLQPSISNAKPVTVPESVRAKTPKLPKLATNRNSVSEEQRESLRQTTLLSQINQLDPKLLQATAYEAIHKGDYNLAQLVLVRAVKVNPNEPVIRRYLAHCLLQEGDPVNALTQYRAFQQLGSASAADRMSFAIALAHAENKEPAQAYFDQMIRESGDDYAQLLIIEQKCEELGLIGQASNAAFLGTKSSVDSQKLEFDRIYTRLRTGNQAAPPAYKGPRLS